MFRSLTGALALALAATLASEAPAQSSNANDRAQQNREDRGNRENRGNGNENRGNGNENRGNANREERGNNGVGRDGWTYGRVISQLRNGRYDDAASDLAEAEELGVVLLSSLPGNAAQNAQALDNALEAAGENVDSLRDEIEMNDAIATALVGAGYDIDDVVGYTVDGDGRVVLILDDRT